MYLSAFTSYCTFLCLCYQSGRGFLGIVMMADKVHLHMTGSVDSGAYFGVDGYTGKTTAEFQSWADEQVNAALGW